MEFIHFLIITIFAFCIHLFQCIENPIVSISQEYIKSVLYSSITDNHQISLSCQDSFFNAINNKDDSYLTKIITDSGKNKNDLGSYQDCLNIDYGSHIADTSSILENLTYIIIQIDQSQSKEVFTLSENEKAKYLFGICIPKGCNETEYKNIFYLANEITGIFPLLNENEIIVYDMTKERFSFLYLLNWIPIFLTLFFMLFSIFKALPVFFFNPLFFKRGNEVNNKIASCFILSDNNEEILSSNEGGKRLVTNETGLSVLKGIRGIAILTIIVSLTFKQLYINPIKIYVQDLFDKLLTSFSFSIVFFGEKFGINICYAISAFALTFKMINFLDYEIETIDEENGLINTNESNSNEKYISLNLDDSSLMQNNQSNFCNLLNENNDKDFLPLNETNIYEKYRAKIKKKTWIKFIARQGYKYIMFISCVFYFKFSQYEPIVLLSSPGPAWLYFKDVILDKFEWKHIFSNIFLYSPFSNATFSSIDPFGILYNEIILFIICSLIVFISFKKNLRLDIIVICLFAFFELGKCALFLLLNLHEDPKERFYPSMIYQESNKKFILSNPFYNFPSALIGIFYGLINNVIQNSSTTLNSKKFLTIPKAIVKFLTDRKFWGYVICIFSLLLFLLSTLIFYIGINTSINEQIESFFFYFWINFISLYSVDIGMIFMFLFVIFLFLTGENFFISFLEHDYWNLVVRPYYSFLIVINMISYFIFYQIESRVKIEFFNICFFSLLILVLSLFGNMILFVFVEIPLKKVNKLLINVDNNKRKKTSMQQYSSKKIDDKSE